MGMYEPAEFLSRLSTNNLANLSAPRDVSIVGLVKSDENTPSAVQFSHSLACREWVSIPIELIEEIDHLKTVSCKDHQHPLVRIKLRKPDEGRQDLGFYYNLISITQVTLALAMRTSKSRGLLEPSLARRSDDFCFIWDDPQGLSVCCFYGDELECTGMV